MLCLILLFWNNYLLSLYYEIGLLCVPTLRITNGNCSPPCSGILGCEKPQSALPLCGFISATFCQPWSRTIGSILRNPLFGLAKRRLP